MRKLLLAAAAALTLSTASAHAETWEVDTNDRGYTFASTWEDNHGLFLGCHGDGALAFDTAHSKFANKVLDYATSFDTAVQMDVDIDGHRWTAAANVKEYESGFMLYWPGGELQEAANLMEAVAKGTIITFRFGRFQVQNSLAGSRDAMARLWHQCDNRGEYNTSGGGGSTGTGTTTSSEIEM